MDTSLAPGYAKMTYNGTLFPHHMTIPINFDGAPTPGEEPDLLLKTGSDNAVDALTNYFEVMRPFFPATVAFGLCEIHSVDDTTGDDEFIFGFDVGLVGTSLVARVALAEDVYSFKLVNGGIYKLYLMEDVSPVNLKAFAPFPAGVYGDLVDFVTGAASPVYGRSNSYPFAAIAQTTKTNDSLRKQNGLS